MYFSVFLYPLLYSPFFSSRGDLNEPGAEALTVVIITVNSLYLVGGVFLLLKALAIEAGVGDKFASIRKRLSSKKLIFTHNTIHVNSRGGEEETTINNGKKNKKGGKNSKSKSKGGPKGGPKMVEMTSQRGRKPARRPTAEIFEGADIHNNPLASLQRMRRRNEGVDGSSGGGSSGGGSSGGEVKTKSRTNKSSPKPTPKPTAMVGFGGFGTVALAGKKWKKKAAAAKKKKQRLEKKKKREEQEVEVEVEDEVEENVVLSLAVDKSSGRRYSVNTLTGESDWVDNEEDVEIRVDVSGKRCVVVMVVVVLLFLFCRRVLQMDFSACVVNTLYLWYAHIFLIFFHLISILPLLNSFQIFSQSHHGQLVVDE